MNNIFFLFRAGLKTCVSFLFITLDFRSLVQSFFFFLTSLVILSTLLGSRDRPRFSRHARLKLALELLLALVLSARFMASSRHLRSFFKAFLVNFACVFVRT